jgi:glycosyltransferase involved in cell wall biosynthesis
MKVLIICSYRKYATDTNYIAPFIYEQCQSLEQSGCEIHYFLLKGGGLKSYCKAIFKIKEKINILRPQVVHAHFGLCGLVANMQRKVPVVTTYHGSDINRRKGRMLSKLAIHLSKHNIFVSQKLIDIAKPLKNFSLIPCGVDLNIFYPQDKQVCRRKLGWNENGIYILFSKAFYVKVKNYPLAKAAVEQIENAELIELKGFTREEVNLLFNACDVALLTSFTEGSPQFVKEAMAANCPVVSTDVGDVKNVINGIENNFICTYEVDDVVDKIKKCLSVKKRNNNSRKIIMESYSLETIAVKIKNIYEKSARNKI